MAGIDKDTIDELIALSKTLDSGALFVSVEPNLFFVLCHKWQSDLIRLVTIEREVQEVIGIDVTNNCTGFSVTPLVKAHPLRQNENGKITMHLRAAVHLEHKKNRSVHKLCHRSTYKGYY